MATNGVQTMRKKMVMIFILDGSRSMNENYKMDALNESMRNAIGIAKDFAAEVVEADIEVAVLLFGTGTDGNQCKWLYGGLQPVCSFVWEDQVASGWAPMADAIREVNRVMHRSEFMGCPSGSLAPVVVMMSDGISFTPSGTMASDLNDTEDAINEISRNLWFINGIRAAIAIGDDADRDILAKFTGDSRTVFDAHSSDRLRDVIEFIALYEDRNWARPRIKPGDDEAQNRFVEASEEEKEDDEYLNSTGWTV